jgi:hypothetical protein
MAVVGPSYWRGPLGRFRLSGAGGGPARNAHKERFDMFSHIMIGSFGRSNRNLAR